MYESHIFQLDMSAGYWRFDMPAPVDEDQASENLRWDTHYEQYHRSEALRRASPVSTGWDLSLISQLHLHIGLRGDSLSISESGGDWAYNTLHFLEFRGLHVMTKLRKLRISFVHGQKVPPMLGAFLRGTRGAPAPSAMRDMMRRLVSSIPKSVQEIRWGLSEEEKKDGAFLTTSMNYYEREKILKTPTDYVHVGPEPLEALAREFEVLRGMDTEYYSKLAEVEHEGGRTLGSR